MLGPSLFAGDSRQFEHEQFIVAKVASRFSDEPGKAQWINLTICKNAGLAQRIAAVLSVQFVANGAGRFSFFGRPDDLVEMLQTFTEELVEYRARFQ